MTERNYPECPTCHSTEHLCMIEVRGVYDGGLYWECMEDGTMWHRWDEAMPRLRAAAEKHMQARREAAMQRGPAQ
jgi:hypothetical protein